MDRLTGLAAMAGEHMMRGGELPQNQEPSSVSNCACRMAHKKHLPSFFSDRDEQEGRDRDDHKNLLIPDCEGSGLGSLLAVSLASKVTSSPKAFVPTDSREALFPKSRTADILPRHPGRLGLEKDIYTAHQANALTERPRFEACAWVAAPPFPLRGKGQRTVPMAVSLRSPVHGKECACRYCLGAGQRMHPFCVVTKADPE